MPVTKTASGIDFAVVHKLAHEAGMAAADARNPTPMIVQQRANPLDDNSPVVKTYEPVMGGVCGFAWIMVRPGNSPYANWLKKQGIGKYSSYEKGVMIWVSYFGQSMEKKEAYAAAYVKSLENSGIPRVGWNSRMD